MVLLQKSARIAATVFALFVVSFADAEDLARIPTHSQRYGSHIGITAFDDPLIKGVTCFISEPHTGSVRGGIHDRRASDIASSVSCHQVGTLSMPVSVPQQAQVFDESVDPIFRAIHVFRILDTKRFVLLYFSYTESELAGDLPGHVDVIRLPARPGDRAAPAE